MFSYFLNKAINGQIFSLLVAVSLVAMFSVPSAYADEFEEEYDEFEDTSFEFADEKYEVEKSSADELRARRKGRAISKFYMFEGPYSGLALQHSSGVIRNNSSRSVTISNTRINASSNDLFGLDGRTGATISLGYGQLLKNSSRFYLGGDFSASTAKRSYQYKDDSVTFKGGVSGITVTESPSEDSTAERSFDIDYDLDFSVRTGYLLQPNNLFYFQGGYSMGFYNSSATVQGSDSSKASLARNSGIASGWNFGFGTEIAASDTTAFRFAWMVRDYDDTPDALDGSGTSKEELVDGTKSLHNFSVRTYAMMTGLTFYFGSDGQNKRIPYSEGEVGDGVYGGIMGQHSNANVQENRVTNRETELTRVGSNPVTGLETTSSDIGRDLGQDFFGLAGFVGYGFDVGRVAKRPGLDGLYFGTEIEFGHPMAESLVAKSSRSEPVGGVSTQVDCSVVSQKRRMNYSLLGRLGYRVTPQTLVYLKGGYGWTQFQTDTAKSRNTSSNCGAAATLVANSSDSSVEKYTLGGYRIGMGVESVVYDNVFMRMDWTYRRHEDRVVLGRPASAVLAGESVNYGGFDDNRISLGFGYSFKNIGPL